MTEPITEFRGPTRWLSNYQECEILYEDITYPSTEHAYQAAKTLDQETRLYIASLPRPAQAKKAGGMLDVRPDWNDIKVEVMTEVILYKFTHHPELRQKLLETGDAELVEGNTWYDIFWGVCKGVGENNLGKILMAVRDSFR